MNYLILTPHQMAVALRNRRKSLNLTQAETAGKVGLLPKTISALENNPERCTLDSFLRLLSALDFELTLQPKLTQTDVSQRGEW